MQEFKKFLALVNRYKLVLLIIPLISVIVAYFLVKNLPNKYISQAQLSTGIADDKQNNVLSQILPNDQVNQGFSNIIEMIKMKKVLDQVSYLLILNDLTSRPFTPQSTLLKTLNPSAKSHAISVYKSKYNKSEGLDLSNSDQAGLNKVLESMGYDSQSILQMLQVYRSGNSDFLIIQVESKSADLSAFIANSLSTEFIKYYGMVVRQNQLKANSFLNKLLVEKTDTLSKRMSALKQYKIQNGVLNLDEQSKQLYTNILEFENKKQEAIQNTSSFAGALNEIDRKFNPNERGYIESRISRVNQEIVSSKRQLGDLYDAYLRSDFDQNYKTSLDSLQEKLNEQIQKSSDLYIVSPLSSKQELISEKIRLEVELDLSRYSINSLESELAKLQSKFNSLVPKEAEVQTLEMNVEIATKEYIDILNKYNENSLESAFSNKVNLIQAAVPGTIIPSKKMLLIILSAIGSFVICLLFIFILYFLDTSILSPTELANKTGFPVLGVICKIAPSALRLKDIWNNAENADDFMVFKNQIRSVRFEVEKEVNGKVLVVTSIRPKQGKSFLIMNLSAAFMITSKRVLIIDGNFTNSDISEAYTSNLYLEDFLTNKVFLDGADDKANITILKNRGGDNSLPEIATELEIKSKMETLKRHFDLIIIDSASLEISNQVKEWIEFADGVVGVFKYHERLNVENKGYIEYLDQIAVFKGWIFNKSV